LSRRLSEEDREKQNARRRRAWDKQAGRYDMQIGWFERHVFGTDNRGWACTQVQGDVLEVAVGTGLNLALYGPDVRLTGIDLSPAMLDIARRRAADRHQSVDLREGDAHHLPFGDESFDSVVCTFSLCNIPDVERAVSEMKRVLKHGGRLILVDHIRSSNKLVYSIQKVVDLLTMRIDGDRMTRRPQDQVRALAFEIVKNERFRLGGMVERVLARKP